MQKQPRARTISVYGRAPTPSTPPNGGGGGENSIMKSIIQIIVGAVALCGCRYDKCVQTDELTRYLDFCRDTAIRGAPGEDWPVDWMVGAGMSSWDSKNEYRIVYADERFLSFRAEEYSYTGGAHGNNKITVGTFDRKMGKRLTVADVIPKSKRKYALALLRKKAIEAIGGKDSLQGEVYLTDNFFIAADGIQFVFNEYEISCYAQGAIEVVLAEEVAVKAVKSHNCHNENITTAILEISQLP